jgi:predicted HicB family RNase H-like nuclease
MVKPRKFKTRKLKVKPPRQTAQLLVRVTPEDMRQFKRDAHHQGLSMSAWARMILRAAVFDSPGRSRHQPVEPKVLR